MMFGWPAKSAPELASAYPKSNEEYEFKWELNLSTQQGKRINSKLKPTNKRLFKTALFNEGFFLRMLEQLNINTCVFYCLQQNSNFPLLQKVYNPEFVLVWTKIFDKRQFLKLSQTVG